MIACTSPCYEFRAQRFYAEHEQYNGGAGLSFFTGDVAQAKSAFESYQRHRRETYSVTVRRCDTGEVLMHAGPSVAIAERSMERAWARRHRN
jgi:hypothetical protein